MSPIFLGGLVAGIALVATALLTPMVRGAALGAGMVRQVQADRWHRRPTPAVGGVAIFSGFVVAVGIGVIVAPDLIAPLGEARGRSLVPLRTWEGLLIASTLMFALGLWDDLHPLRPLAKFGGQLVGASILLASGLGVYLTGIQVVDAFLSLLWFVAVTNAVNLLDNMDGVAAGVTTIAATFLAFLLVLDGQGGLAILALALAASTLGFLAHNYPPARIFMGDSGALFLGILLAGLALAPAQGLSRGLAAVVLVPAAVLAVPLLDTTLVAVGRALEGRSIAEGGRDHTAHHLVSVGVSEERAMWILWGLAALAGGVGVIIRSTDRTSALLLGGFLALILGIVGTLSLRLRLRSLEDSGEGSDLLGRLVSLHERLPLLLLLMDALLVAAAYHLSYRMRWDAAALAGELAYYRSTAALVVTTKVAIFTLAGLYQPRWGRFGLSEAGRVLRLAGLGSAAALALLLMVARLGLSRGVMITDLVLTVVFLVGARTILRLVAGVEGRRGGGSTSVVLLAPAAEMEFMMRALPTVPEGAALAVVAGADPSLPTATTSVAGLQVYGEAGALARALAETRAGTVVLLDRGQGGELPESLRRHLAEIGGVDVYRLSLALEAVEGPPVPSGRVQGE